MHGTMNLKKKKIIFGFAAGRRKGCIVDGQCYIGMLISP
jgi:hypothetical protein